VRKALEQCDAAGDLNEFVSKNATGNKIADSPQFVNFASGDHGLSQRPVYKSANFIRSSARSEVVHTGQSLQDLAAAIKPSGQQPRSAAVTPTGEVPPGQRSRRQSENERAKSQSRPNSYHSTSNQDIPQQQLQPQPGSANQYVAAPRSATPNPVDYSQQPLQSPAMPNRQTKPEGYVAPNIPAVNTATKQPVTRTPNQEDSGAANRDRSTVPTDTNDNPTTPQTATFSSESSTPTTAPIKKTTPLNFDRPKDKQDPIARALAALRDPARAGEVAEPLPTSPLIRNKSQRSTASNSPAPNNDLGSRRNTTGDIYAQSQQVANQANTQSKRQSMAAPPSQYNRSRPASPALSQATSQRAVSPAPQANMMRPPSSAGHYAQMQDTQAVLAQYGQSLPGERSRSRANSVASARSHHQETQGFQSSGYTPHPAAGTAYERAQQSASPIPYVPTQQRPFQPSMRPVSPRPQSANSNYNSQTVRQQHIPLQPMQAQRQSYAPQPTRTPQEQQMPNSQSSYRVASPNVIPSNDPYARPPSSYSYQNAPVQQSTQQRQSVDYQQPQQRHSVDYRTGMFSK